MRAPAHLLNRAAIAAIRVRDGDTPRVQARALRDILASTRGTWFASQHGLRGDEDADAYREKVPVLDSDDLAPIWERAERGEPRVFTRDRILGVALTAGSTGAPKRVPVTPHLLRALRRLQARALLDHLRRRPGSRVLLRYGLAIAGQSKQEVTEGGLPCGVLSGLAVRLSPPIARLRMLPGLDVLDEPDWDRKLDRMVEAVDGRRLGALGGVPSSILDFLRRAEARLPHDAFRRAVGGVELALSSGVAFARSRDEIEALLGHDVDVAELYTATEGAYGIQVEPGRPVFELLPERLFFEFVPESQWDAGRCDASLLLHELEAGERYVPLVTNGSGAFRYPIGDRICCHSAGSAPHIELAGRLSLTLNLVGEKTSAEVVHAVAKELAREAGGELAQFTVTGRSGGESPCYEWILPAEADWNDRSEKELAEHVDALTARHHDRYRAHRAQRLGPPRVHLVSTERLERWAARQGADAGHRKVPPIVEDPQQLADLLDEG